MFEQAPILEVLVVPEGDGARLYVAGWCSPALRGRLDSQRSAALSVMPDLADLDRFMWAADAPYVASKTNGRTEIAARGRAAVVLDSWCGNSFDLQLVGLI